MVVLYFLAQQKHLTNGYWLRLVTSIAQCSCVFCNRVFIFNNFPETLATINCWLVGFLRHFSDSEISIFCPYLQVWFLLGFLHGLCVFPRVFYIVSFECSYVMHMYSMLSLLLGCCFHAKFNYCFYQILYFQQNSSVLTKEGKIFIILEYFVEHNIYPLLRTILQSLINKQLFIMPP